MIQTLLAKRKGLYYQPRLAKYLASPPPNQADGFKTVTKMPIFHCADTIGLIIRNWPLVTFIRAYGSSTEDN